MKQLVATAALLLAACGSPQPKSEELAEEKPVPASVEKPAEPPPDTDTPLDRPPLELRFREGWNQHHHFGASGMHLSSEVVVYLHEGGAARVTDSGEHRTSELSNDWGYKEEKRIWDNAWHGRWKVDADSLVLELSPSKHDCKLHITDYGDRKSVKDCPQTPPTVSLECKAQQVDVAPTPLSRDEDRRPHDVWVCFPAQGADALGGSPPSWVFDKSACLRIATGFRGKGRSFSLCEEIDQKGANPPADQ